MASLKSSLIKSFIVSMVRFAFLFSCMMKFLPIRLQIFLCKQANKLWIILHTLVFPLHQKSEILVSQCFVADLYIPLQIPI